MAQPGSVNYRSSVTERVRQIALEMARELSPGASDAAIIVTAGTWLKAAGDELLRSVAEGGGTQESPATVVRAAIRAVARAVEEGGNE